MAGSLGPIPGKAYIEGSQMTDTSAVDAATTGTKAVSSPGSAKSPCFAARIQPHSCPGAKSCRRATSTTTAPGAIASATI